MTVQTTLQLCHKVFCHLICFLQAQHEGKNNNNNKLRIRDMCWVSNTYKELISIFRKFVKDRVRIWIRLFNFYFQTEGVVKVWCLLLNTKCMNKLRDLFQNNSHLFWGKMQCNISTIHYLNINFVILTQACGWYLFHIFQKAFIIFYKHSS